MLSQKARNRRLELILTILQTQIGVFQVYGIHLASLWLLSLNHHLRILDGLTERDC
jgi:hypothetical protein